MVKSDSVCHLFAYLLLFSGLFFQFDSFSSFHFRNFWTLEFFSLQETQERGGFLADRLSVSFNFRFSFWFTVLSIFVTITTTIDFKSQVIATLAYLSLKYPP